MNGVAPESADVDLINFDSPRLPRVPEIKVAPSNEDDVDKENCSGVGNEVVYLDSTFNLSNNGRKSVGNESANGQMLADLIPLKNTEDGCQNDRCPLVKFDANNSDFLQEDASYDALGIGSVDISNAKMSAENSLNENRLEINAVDCPNGKLSPLCPAEIQTEDKNETITLSKVECSVECMDVDETIVDQSTLEYMSGAFEGSADLDIDIEDIELGSYSISAEVEKEIEKIHQHSQEEEQLLREKTKNIINLKKYFEASSEDLQYIYWQKAILDDEFERNSELTAREVEYTQNRTEEIQQQIDVVEELKFENNQFKEMLGRVKLLIELIHIKDEKMKSLMEVVNGLNQEIAQIKQDGAEEREKLREENRILVDKLSNENRILSEEQEKLREENRILVDELSNENRILSEKQEKLREENRILVDKLSKENCILSEEQEKLREGNRILVDKLSSENRILSGNVEKVTEENCALVQENEQLKSRQVEKEVENRNLLEKLEELKISCENDLTKLKTDMDDKLKAEESRAFNFYLALKKYEENWISFHEKYEQMHRKNKKMSDDLAILEVAFKNVVDKFEQSKSLIEGYKGNETIYEDNIKKYKAKLEEEYERYKTLKDHATNRFEEGNKQYLELKVTSNTNAKKQSRIIQRLEIKLSATEELYLQKNTECERLAKLCDEVTGSV